jgi:hypothetical protein
MSRRTVTVDATLDQIINLVRGFFLLVGQEYNYTEVVNAAIFYGICYWLNVPKETAMKMASQVLSRQLKIEGIKDEQWDRMSQQILSKLTPLKK